MKTVTEAWQGTKWKKHPGKLHRGWSERRWKGVYSLEWKFSMAGPGYMDQWSGRNELGKKKCESTNDHIWSSKKTDAGMLEKCGSGFWSGIMRLFKFLSMALTILCICRVDYSHSISPGRSGTALLFLSQLSLGVRPDRPVVQEDLATLGHSPHQPVSHTFIFAH